MAEPIEQNDFALGEPFKFQNPGMALTAINSIDSVIQITSDVNVVLDQMMDAVLEIFNSSRAWLFHPCNPKLPSFDVTFESTTSEYPGANSLKQQVPMTDDMADYCRRALSAMDGPEIDPPEGQPLTNDIAIRFNVKSMLFMALRPKSGEPWMFGLHQCDRDRIWTRDEKQLFQMIGKRISVCLDNLLFIGQLRESNEKFRNLSNMLPQIVFETDQKGNLTFANHNAFSTFGYTYDEFESGLNAIDMIAPVDRNRAAERMLEVMNGVDSTLNNEYIATKKDGTEFPVIIYSSQILRNGAPAGLRGIIVDIGDRKLAEEQLRKSEEKYRAIFENVKEGILIAQDNKLKLVNRAAEKILGYSAEIITSRSFTDFIHPDDRDTVFERYKRIMDGENVETDYAFRIVTESGEERWLEIHSSLLNWENQLSTINFITDITERKNAQASLRESEGKFRNLVETISDVIFEVDAQGTVTYLSPSVLKTWGGALSDLVGKNFMELVHPDDQEQLVKRFIELQQGIEKPMIYRFVDRSGRLLWGRSHSTPIWKDGRFAGARGTLVDLTAQKEAEAEKEKLQQKLLQAQKMESVGRLAGGVAHDFNNMLSVILGYTEIGLEQVEPGHPLHDGLREVQKASMRSADITRQLLAFARKQTIAPKVLNLNATVEGMLNMLRRLIGEHIDLAWQPATNLWPMRMDPSQVDQILANLCVNARDAITDVGKITIETGTATLDEDYCADHPGCVPGDFVMLMVSDDGCGMDQEIQANLFEPFFTTKGVDKGTGLGLATVYGIVKQNNGFIDVASEPGRGTIFRIYLPRHEASLTPVLSKDPLTPDAQGSETILLVEDEPSILRMTRMMLKRMGYKVLTAGTPGEAIALAREHAGEIHLLMTDVVMPEMNGRDLARNLLSLYPNLKRLFMSGYTANVIAHHGVLDEGVQFIQKPFAKQDLANKVREVLDEAK